MAKGKTFNEHLVIEFARRMNQAAEGSKERGEILRWFMEITGVSKNTAYAILKKVNEGVGFSEVASAKQTRKPRKDELTIALEKRHAMIVSAIKRRPGEDKKWIPTKHAVRIAESMGQIPVGLYASNRMDRLMHFYGLNKASAGTRPAAWSLTAKYPGHVLAVDATPIDHYYLKLDRSVQRYDTPRGDKHLDDILARERLSKIWVYYAVDMFSKSFLVMPFASLPKGAHSRNPGENADDWMAFLRWVMLPKSGLSPIAGKTAPFLNCPFEGAPEILYCDKGSGIGNSSLVNDMCLGLGTDVRIHTPGNPSAKGIVESRIGAFKRSFECQLDINVVKDINQLIYFYMKWADWWNEKQGFYEAWRRGLKNHAIRMVNEQSFHDAAVSNFTRVIDGFGCVSIDGAKWFVTWDEKYLHTKVKIYRPYAWDGEVKYTARLKDGKIIRHLSNGKPEHDFEEIKSYPKSAAERNRDEARELAGSINTTMILDDILPADSDTNIVSFPNRGDVIETSSPCGPDTFKSVERAWRWMLNQTGLFMEQIPDQCIDIIQNSLILAVKTHGYVPVDIVMAFTNLLIQSKEEGVNEQ